MLKELTIIKHFKKLVILNPRRSIRDYSLGTCRSPMEKAEAVWRGILRDCQNF